MFLSKHITQRLLNIFKIRSILRVFRCDARKRDFYKYTWKPAKYSKPAFSHSKLMGLLLKCNSVSEQIELFYSHVKLTDEDVANRIFICKNIENIFKSTFPDCSVDIIGSSTNGMGIGGCDMDITFQFTNSQVSSVQTNIIPNIDVSSGKISSSKFSTLTIKQQLIFLQKLLKEGGLSIESEAIVPGRIPILNFHCNGVSCDLSLSNSSALLATNLMKLCGNQDQRVVFLYILITYWAKHCKLVGGPMKFKSYSLFLLIIYFLQSRNPPILPPIEKIFLETRYYENSNDVLDKTSQCMEKSFISNNSEVMEKLLREFFFFYSSFDFSSVICPLNAKLIPGKQFILENPAFELNTLSIQDPLNLNHNVTSGVHWKHCKGFIRGLLTVCDIYHGSSQHPNPGTKWGLVSLLDCPVDSYNFASRENFELTLSLSKLTKPLIAVEKVSKLLSKGLLFQQLSNKTENQSLIKSEAGLDLMHFKQTADFQLGDTGTKYGSFEAVFVAAPTWLSRSNYDLRNYDCDEQSFLKTEAEISECILKNRKVDDKEDFKFLCELSYFSENDNDYLHVNFKSLNSKIFIPKLGIFLKEYIHKYSLRYL